MTTRKNPKGAHCSIPGCEKWAITRGWCQHHYFAWRRYGNPLARKNVKGGAPLKYVCLHQETYDALVKIKKGTFDETIRSLLPS